MGPETCLLISMAFLIVGWRVRGACETAPGATSSFSQKTGEVMLPNVARFTLVVGVVIMTACVGPVHAKPSFAVVENPAGGVTESFVLFDNPPGTDHALRANPLTTAKVPTIGDLFPFNNKFYPVGTAVYGSVPPPVADVGNDSGTCVLTRPWDGGDQGNIYDCVWTNHIKAFDRIHAGAIMVAGPFTDFGVSTVAITGGTGAYSKARGTAHVIPVFRDHAGNVLLGVHANNIPASIHFANTTYIYEFYFE